MKHRKLKPLYLDNGIEVYGECLWCGKPIGGQSLENALCVRCRYGKTIHNHESSQRCIDASERMDGYVGKRISQGFEIAASNWDNLTYWDT